MSEPRTNKANLFARDCIYTALVILMNEKDFNQITVTEIAERAGVSRVTYYRNYQSKEDILIQKLEEVFDKYIEKLRSKKEGSAPYFYGFIDFFCDNNKLITNLVNSRHSHLLMKQFRAFADQVTELYMQNKNEHLHYYFHFLTGGLLFMLIEWVESGMPESALDMSRLFDEYIFGK